MLHINLIWQSLTEHIYSVVNLNLMFCLPDLNFFNISVNSFRMGPMDSELKQRKRAVSNRKRKKPGAGVKPEEVRNVLQIPVIFSF